MANALQSALNSKVGNYLRGRSVVNNAANPASAYSMSQRTAQNSASKQSPQAAQQQRRMTKTYSNTVGKTFGSPMK